MHVHEFASFILLFVSRLNGNIRLLSQSHYFQKKRTKYKERETFWNEETNGGTLNFVLWKDRIGTDKCVPSFAHYLCESLSLRRSVEDAADGVHVTLKIVNRAGFRSFSALFLLLTRKQTFPIFLEWSRDSLVHLSDWFIPRFRPITSLEKYFIKLGLCRCSTSLLFRRHYIYSHLNHDCVVSYVGCGLEACFWEDLLPEPNGLDECYCRFIDNFRYWLGWQRK